MIRSERATRGRILGLASVLLLLVPIAAACGGDDDSAAATDTEPAATDTEPAATDTEPAATDTEPASEDDSSNVAVTPDEQADVSCVGRTLTADSWDPNATFTYIHSVGPTSWVPWLFSSNNANIYTWQIYDTLLQLSDDFEVLPMLAKDYTLLDDNTVEMHLIENYNFHDGQPFNAEAVKANLEHARDYPGGWDAQTLSIVTDVEVVDEYTVRIHTNAPVGPMLPALAQGAGAMMSPLVLDDPDQATNPKGGSGAYELAEYVTDSMARFERVDDYWCPDAARVKEIVIRVGDDEARMNYLLSGEADGIHTRAAMIEPAVAGGAVEGDRPGYTLITVIVNTAQSEFDKKEVRQALSIALDREAIAQTLYQGLCDPQTSIVPGWLWAGNPDIGPDSFPRDLDKARQLLADAGLADGFSFDLLVYNITLYQQIAEVMQANWAEIGVNANLVVADYGTTEDNFKINKTGPAQLAAIGGSPDPSELIDSFMSPEGIRNPGGFDAGGMDDLLAEARRGTTEERGALYHGIIATADEEQAPAIPICAQHVMWLHSKRTQDFPEPASTPFRFRGVSISE